MLEGRAESTGEERTMVGGGTPYVLCEDLFKIYKIADLEVVALRGLDLAVESGRLWLSLVPAVAARRRC